MHVRDTAPAGATGLTLVPYVDPTGGMRVYQTQVADAQSAFVLHPAVTPAGIEPGAPGLVEIGGQTPSVEIGALVTGSVGQSTFDVQQPAVANLATANALPVALMEQVFGSMEQAAVMQEITLVQPGISYLRNLATKHPMVFATWPCCNRPQPRSRRIGCRTITWRI